MLIKLRPRVYCVCKPKYLQDIRRTNTIIILFCTIFILTVRSEQINPWAINICFSMYLRISSWLLRMYYYLVKPVSHNIARGEKFSSRRKVSVCVRCFSRKCWINKHLLYSYTCVGNAHNIIRPGATLLLQSST